jgi:hypothetical protein
MKKLLFTAALAPVAVLLSACGDNDAETPEADTAVVETDTADTADTTTAAADPNWPAGTRIVEENDVVYRVNADGTRVEIEDDSYRIVTEGGVRYRVDAGGVRHRIDDDGLDIDLPAVEGVDVDLGTNRNGNLDLDVSTDGTDASNDRGGDR